MHVTIGTSAFLESGEVSTLGCGDQNPNPILVPSASGAVPYYTIRRATNE